MTWSAYLRGDADDLHALGDQFGSGDVVVEQHGDEWALTSPRWTRDVDLAVIRNEAGLLVRRLDGVGRMLDPDFGGVELVGRYTDGTGTHLVITVDGIASRARVGTATIVVTDADGNVVPPPTPPPPVAPTYVRLAERNADVDEVLGVFAQSPSLGWVELYKVFEIVRADVGGDNRLSGSGLALPVEISAFRASACLPSVSGSAARHARASGGVPKRTMTIDEGRRFVRRLVAAWLERLSS
ncbi:MAG TPA: hypothetical protein VFQ85_04815 [Mycobacteriales bacterium]|jgi:hypothetical protein|nr:hypothetical protein [Mycobacteriales bacterium]